MSMINLSKNSPSEFTRTTYTKIEGHREYTWLIEVLGASAELKLTKAFFILNSNYINKLISVQTTISNDKIYELKKLILLQDHSLQQEIGRSAYWYEDLDTFLTNY